MDKTTEQALLDRIRFNTKLIKEVYKDTNYQLKVVHDKLQSYDESIDKKTHQKVLEGLHHYIGVKWQSLTIILTAFSVMLFIYFYINNQTLNAVEKNTKKLEDIAKSMNASISTSKNLSVIEHRIKLSNKKPESKK